MKRKKLFIIVGLLCYAIPLSSGGLFSVKLKNILYHILNFPLNDIPPAFKSHNIQESKTRGIFIHDYQMPPLIEYKDSLIGFDFKEAFLEHWQYYKFFKNELIIDDRWTFLVLVLSEQGEKAVKEWNDNHYYRNIMDRNYFDKHGIITLPLEYYYPDSQLKINAKNLHNCIYADTLVIDMKLLFYKKHRPHPDDIKEIWKDYYNLGTITLIRKDAEKKDSGGTKWVIPFPKDYYNFDYYHNRIIPSNIFTQSEPNEEMDNGESAPVGDAPSGSL